MDFKEFGNTIEAEAIAEKLAPTEDYLWRFFCREYAREFFTPLHTVLEMSPEFVLKHLYESRLEKVDLEKNLQDVMDQLYSIEDPDFDRNKAKELREIDDKILMEEEERIRQGKAVHQWNTNKNPIDKDEEGAEYVPTKELPKSGYVDLSYLEKQDREG